MDIKVLTLGVRGSVSVSGSEYQEYGAATSCTLITWGEEPEEAIMLDAGTGALKLERYLPKTVKKITVLLSHPHLDHIGGLLLLPLMFKKEIDVEIYAAKRAGLSNYEQFKALMQPPSWPVTPEVFSKKVHFCDLGEEPIEDENKKITYIEGTHPGGVTIYKIEIGEKAIVYATDHEIGAAKRDEELLRFAKGCDLILGDGAYSEEDLASKKGFGHSAWTQMAELGKKCGAKEMRITHHSPFYDDSSLRQADIEVKAIFSSAKLAKENEVIVL